MYVAKMNHRNIALAFSGGAYRQHPFVTSPTLVVKPRATAGMFCVSISTTPSADETNVKININNESAIPLSQQTG